MMGSSEHLLYLYSIYTISTDVLCIVMVIQLRLHPMSSSKLECWEPTLGGLLRCKQFSLRQHILTTLF